MPSLPQRAFCEWLGTAFLLAAVVGSGIMAQKLAGGNGALALLCNTLPTGAILVVLILVFGPLSGAHFNPAVTLAFALRAGLPWSTAAVYIIAQVLGGIAGAGVLYVIASGKAGFSLAGGFASNGYGEHSPGGYSLVACLVAEVVLTFMFLMIILGATDKRAPQGFAPIAIGLGLTLIHLIGIPVTNLSVNPARSTGPAVFVGGWAIHQLWLFWLAPIAGAAIAGFVYPLIAGSDEPHAQARASRAA